MFMGIFDKLKFWKKEEDFDFSTPDLEPPVFPRQNAAEPSFEGDFPRAQGVTEPSFNQDFQPRKPRPSSAPEFFESPSLPRSFQERQEFQPSVSAPASAEQKIELISSKLDTIKAQLETVLQRLDRMEQNQSQNQSRPYQQRLRN